MEKIGDSVAVDDNSVGGEKKVNDQANKNDGEKKKKKKVKSGGGGGDGQNKAKKKKKKVIVISASTDATKAAAVLASEGGAKGCRVQVSNTKKPLFFYLNVAKKYIKQNNYVELSALGMAIPTVVTISEILKKDGWVTEKKIGTSTVTLKDEAKGRIIMKAKIEILLERCKGAVATKGKPESNEKEEAQKSEGKVAENLTVQKATCDGKMADKVNSECAQATAVVSN